MKAAVLEQGGFRVKEVDTPKAGAGEVIVKVSYCGICGSDLHIFAANRGAGNILGHEFSGVVAEIGEGVQGWSVGQHVTPSPFSPCWRCHECTHGMPHMCREATVVGIRVPGAYAEYVKVKAAQLFATPEGVTDQQAATNEPLSVALHAVLLAEITVGSSVAVVGAGPIGLMAIQCARVAGASRIFVAQRSEPRASMAKEVGADIVVKPQERDFRRAIREHVRVGADAALECVGSPEAFDLAVRAVRPGGRVIMVGAAGQPTPVVLSELMRREIVVKGSLGFWHEFPVSLELQRRREVKTERIITRIVPLSDIQDAFAGLMKARDQVKVLVGG